SAAAPLWPARAALPAGAGRARSVPPPVWGARGELGARAGAVHAPRGVHGCPTRGAPRGAAAHKREKAARPNGSDKKASASGATKAAGAGARGAGAGAARPVHGRRRGADARARDRAAPPMLSRRGATLRPREESADRAGVCEALSSCSSSSPVLRTARHKQTEETSHKKHHASNVGRIRLNTDSIPDPCGRRDIERERGREGEEEEEETSVGRVLVTCYYSPRRGGSGGAPGLMHLSMEAPKLKAAGAAAVSFV
ncbi:unnamed protein product, partial [Prorocentrum cordatum]